MGTGERKTDQKKWNPGTKPDPKTRPQQPPPSTGKPKEFGVEKTPRKDKEQEEDMDT